MLTGRDEIVRRRGLVPPGHHVEAWPDHHVADAFWLGEDTKALLDAVGPPLPATLTLDAASVGIYYGARLCDIDSLPPEDSVKARVLSAHGIAAAWTTLDRFGARTTYQPQSLTDPMFYLRRIGGGASHAWRTLRTRREAAAYLREAYGDDEDAQGWARALPAEHFDELIARHATRA